MGIEFLGHKEGLLPFITSHIQRESGGGDVFLDLFCGTGAVAAAFKTRGYRVIANDHMTWCRLFAEALLFNNCEPTFAGVVGTARSPSPGRLFTSPHEMVLELLNGLPPARGFIYQTYSPASKEHCGVERMYFSQSNAGKIDAVRQQIAEWEPDLTRGEKAILVMDLLKAANAVCNTAGTYGCYLKHWKPKALNDLELLASPIASSCRADHQVFREDANDLVSLIDADVVYADPPYTKRQYAAYYHILETIAVGDEPCVEGATGLRPWRDKASEYCYRGRAALALRDLVTKLRCRDFFLSYNSDGQIDHREVLEILADFGSVQTFELSNKRYKSSSLRHSSASVTERLYHLSVEGDLRG